MCLRWPFCHWSYLRIAVSDWDCFLLQAVATEADSTFFSVTASDLVRGSQLCCVHPTPTVSAQTATSVAWLVCMYMLPAGQDAWLQVMLSRTIGR